tara:strand:+ start:159 stop:353 length:195 start_codon:yes stop_codon:yes gene_type:complete
VKIKIYNKRSDGILKAWNTSENNGHANVFQKCVWIQDWYKAVGKPMNKVQLFIEPISYESKIKV